MDNFRVNLDPEFLEREAERKAGRKPAAERNVTNGSGNNRSVNRTDSGYAQRRTPKKAESSYEAVRKPSYEEDDDEVSAAEFYARKAQASSGRAATGSRERRANGERIPAGSGERGANGERMPASSRERGANGERIPEGSRERSANGTRRTAGSGDVQANGIRRTGTDSIERTGLRERTNVKKKLPIYWISLGIYTLVLIILGAVFLSYTNKCLIRYEKAQPENAMSDLLVEYEKMVNDGSLADKINIPASSEFDGQDVFKEKYMTVYNGVKEYTYEKNKSSYASESPMYDIYADGNYVAKVTLASKNEKTIFGLLRVMDWEIAQIEPVFTTGTHDYLISVPKGYKITVNGKEVADSYKTGKEYLNPDYTNTAEYTDMPLTVEYKITGLANVPEIKVYTADGTEAEYSLDESGNVTLEAGGAVSDMPQERKDEAYKMAKTWEDFLTNDLTGDSHGLAEIRKYLIKDSYYWNMATDYAGGPDINFISDHTLADPAYSDIVIDNYVIYNENCYSCHISFNKNMILTRTGESRVDSIDSTFYFVNYDDTDDGVDNPHWAIVDMISTTAGGEV